MKESLEMILLESGCDSVALVKNIVENAVRVVPIVAGCVCIDSAKDGSAEGFLHSSCEVVSFNLSTRMTK
jgi:hypothetical protein